MIPLIGLSDLKGMGYFYGEDREPHGENILTFIPFNHISYLMAGLLIFTILMKYFLVYSNELSFVWGNQKTLAVSAATLHH